jgi:hypothetical protein
MVTNSSLLRVIFPRQSLALIVVYILVVCPPKISQSVRIYRTLARTQKKKKKKKKLYEIGTTNMTEIGQIPTNQKIIK